MGIRTVYISPESKQRHAMKALGTGKCNTYSSTETIHHNTRSSVLVVQMLKHCIICPTRKFEVLE